MVNANAFYKFTNLVTQRLFQTVDFRSRVHSAGVSLLESISSFGIVAVDEPDTCDLGVLFCDKELGAHPFGLTVLVDVD